MPSAPATTAADLAPVQAALPAVPDAGVPTDIDQSAWVERVWCLKANCALTPAQFAWRLAPLAAVSLAIGAAFWHMGATAVLPFACVETLALGVAYLMYARTTQDQDELRLTVSHLTVTRQRAGRIEVESFPRAWVQVLDQGGRLIEIRSGGRRMVVGDGLNAIQRQETARDLQQALRRTNCVSN